MKDGNVISAKVLPIVTRLMQEKAQGGLTAYQATTQFQHGRFSNAFSDLVLTLGKGGFDAGMSKIFKSLADVMQDNEATVKNLGARFKDLSVIFEGIVGQSSRIIQGFTDMTGTFGSVLTVGLALYKLIGRKGSIFGLLVLALDDLDAYVSGGDSVLGKFIGYMTDLTGMDWNAISVGIGAVGIAIGLAFAPLTTLALSIGALIIAYKYLQDLKAKEKPIVPESSTLPTTNEFRAHSANQAKEFYDKNPTVANAMGVAWANSIGLLDLTGGYVATAEGTDFGAPRPYAKTVAKLQGFLDKGVISSDEYTRAAASLGSGYKTADSIEAWLGNRTAAFGTNNQPFYKPQAPVMQFSGDIIVNGATDPQNFANSLMHFYVPEGTAAKSNP